MFNKNMDKINNESLKRRLEKINPLEARKDISYIITKSNDYILLKNDIPIDDLENPREAIRQHLAASIKKEMKPSDIIITFGIGLGYLLDETFNKYPSKIFVYEPDLDLLHFVLSNIDISEHLESGRVYVTNDLDELLSKLNSVYLSNDKVEIVYLKNYAVVHNKELLLLTQKVFESCKSKLVDVNTIAKFSERWLVNTLDNISSINNQSDYLLSDLENKFIGQTAIILGAGPSLNDNIDNIKANRYKFVIFAVNKVVKYLEQNGITPDFIVCLDAGNMVKTLDVNPVYLARTNCITDLRADSTIFGMNFKKIFVNFSDTDYIVSKLAKTNSCMKIYESGGTSTLLALISAAKMGFSKIIIAGIDLAFKNDVIYADGSTINRVTPDEIVVDSVKKNLVQVKSITGNMVYTRDDYQAFIYQFGEVIKMLEYPNIYNLSSFGAEIPGVKPVKFEMLSLMVPAKLSPLDEINPFKIEFSEFIQDEFCNINNIISILAKETYSAELVSSIIKSVLVYQYMQKDILTTLQSNFNPQLAEEFINKTKQAIKLIVETLQRDKML